jgi:hypothetical protein
MMLRDNVGTLGHIADLAFGLTGFATLKSLQIRPATLSRSGARSSRSARNRSTSSRRCTSVDDYHMSLPQIKPGSINHARRSVIQASMLHLIGITFLGSAAQCKVSDASAPKCPSTRGARMRLIFWVSSIASPCAGLSRRRSRVRARFSRVHLAQKWAPERTASQAAFLRMTMKSS